MRTTYRFILLILLLSVGALQSNARTLSLSQAKALALKTSHELKVSKAEVLKLDARRKALRGSFLPKLSLEANILYWDSALPFDLGDLGALFEPLMPPNTTLDMGNIRDQLTSQVSVTLAQPITPLLTISKGYQAIRSAKAAAHHGFEAKRLDIVADIEKAYVHVKQAEAGVQIAKDAVKQVNAQLTRVIALRKAGLAEHNDQLKTEVGLAQAKGGLIRAQAGYQLAIAALALKLGLSPSEKIDLNEQFAVPTQHTQNFDNALKQAYANRPEMSALKSQVDARYAQLSAAKRNLIPNLAAIATYQHNEGLSFGSPKDAFFVGGVLTWDITWGTHYFKIDEAHAATAQAKAQQKHLKDGIYLQVKQAHLALQTAFQTLTIAQAMVKQAQEAYRIEIAKYEKQASTTTDVLDTQLSLNRAKLQENNALYSWHLARFALKRAIAKPSKEQAKQSNDSAL